MNYELPVEGRLVSVEVTFDVRAFPFAPGVEFRAWHPSARQLEEKRPAICQTSGWSHGLTSRESRASFECSLCSIYTRALQTKVSKSMSVTPRASSNPIAETQILTMLQNAETAVGTEVLHTCSPTKYVSVFPVTGIPSICVRVILGISQKYGTKRGKISPYLLKNATMKINKIYIRRKSWHNLDLRARRQVPVVIRAQYSWRPDEQDDWYLQCKRNETSGKQVGCKLLGA